MVVGAVIFAAGLLLSLVGPAGLGRLPGDIVYRRGSFTFFFPLATSILLSIALSLIFWFLRR
jgi:hypothetical protein